MSRHHFQAGEHEVIVGWDPPLRTYFGQVYEPEPEGPCELGPDCALAQAGFGKHDLSRCRDNPPVLWVGVKPMGLPTVDMLADAMGRFGGYVRDYAGRRDELEADRHADR